MAQIPFTRGVPSPDLLPVDDLRAAADKALASEPALALSYLGGGGHPGLRSWIGARHGVPAERVVASNGSLQAFLFVSELLVARASTPRVLVEAPTYDRPLILLRRSGAEPVGIPVDEHGLDVDALEDDLRRAGAPAFLYVIPTFQNPSGSTLPLARRERLVELSHRFGFPIVEDDPYGLLRFRGDSLPTIHSLDPDRVITMSSFTKTVAPGLRIGYAVAPADLATRLTRHALDTYIGPGALAQSTLFAYTESGRFEPNVERAAAELGRRAGVMAAALREHFPAATTFVEPDGGYFLWVDLGRDGPDTTR
ncbi:MAG: 2-aminoadipate transaminase, partial [Gaiellales bacterium]|nr:2-aminoadipate transaminase [Gaiellales bacterium]